MPLTSATPPSTMPLTNKVALITSSRKGACANTAKRLAQAGAKVMICGRNAAQGRETVSQIQQAGGRAAFVLTDITMPGDVQAAVDETIATYGRLDIMCNSAATGLTASYSLLETSETVWDQVIEASLKGVFLCCQYAIPFLENAGNGTIINLLEPLEAARTNGIMPICYGGIFGLTRSLAQHFPQGAVRINAIWAAAQSEPVSEMVRDRILQRPISNPLTSDNLSNAEPATAELETAAFETIEEAVMYLALADSSVQGYTLVVPSSSPAAS